MNEKEQELKEGFRQYFRKLYGTNFDVALAFNEGDGWINCPVANAMTDAIHYELFRDGDEYFAEFHVEVQPRFVPAWQALRNSLDGNKRHFHHYTYYSSNYWRYRNPVIEVDNLVADFNQLVNIVSSIFGGPLGDVHIPTKNGSIFFSLHDIATWFDRKQTAKEKPIVEIPAFQRRLVWNAAQIEVLWDSLLRNIPIGAFSLLPMRGNERYSTTASTTAPLQSDNRYFLLDGQQRASAIAMGYKDFPTKSGKGETESILWVDLLPSTKERDRSNRKYFFWVTTPARPWGYRIEDANGENHAGKVPVFQYMAALKEIHWVATMSQKPKPSQLWPVCARFPVPVAILRNLSDSSLSLAGLIAVGGDASWACHLKTVADALGVEDAQKLENEIVNLRNRLLNASRTKIMAMIAPEGLVDTPPSAAKDGDNSEIALYFSRLNRSGTTPSREDLDYSILKSILPELHAIDDCAKERMHPARLANLAMLTFLSATSNTGWKNGLTRQDIFALRSKPDFFSYVSSDLPQDIASIDNWLLFKSGTAERGIPEYLRTRISRQNPNLFRFLLLLAGQVRKKRDFRIATNADFSCLMTAFCTTLVWFGNDSAMDFAALAKRMGEVAEFSVCASRKIFGNWMSAQVEANTLEIPPSSNYFREIANKAKDGDKDAIVAAWSVQPDSNAANRIWYWHREEGRGIVLYACRKYLNETFSDYDPATAVWNEDARPWDYDHIVPQSWIKYSHHNRNYHDLVAEFINSIGNIAPIPFYANRSKGNIPPGEVGLYRDAAAKESLFLDFYIDGCIPKFVNEYLILEEDKTAAINFARIAANRMSKLYSEWWNSLNIHELLVCCTNEYRRTEIEAFADELRKRFPESTGHMQIVYVMADGKQKGVVELWDWARPWISCGISGRLQRNESDDPIRCFLCQTFQNGRREFGLRRHPDETSIDGKNEWWISDHHQTEGDFFDYVKTILGDSFSSGGRDVFVID